VITRIGPFEVRKVRDLLEALSKFPVGSDAELQFRRRTSMQTTTVPLEENPHLEADAE
jgi:hypothetical protein